MPRRVSRKKPAKKKGGKPSFVVAGLDPSLTGTAICFLDRRGVYRGATTFSVDKCGLARILDIERFVVRMIENTEPDIVYIEGFSYASRGRGAVDIGMLGGVLRRRLHVDGVSYVEVPPMSLKKFVCGKGNANKNVVLEQTFRRYGIGSETLTDDNQVDAYCLAQFGLAHLGHKPATKAQQAVLDKVEKWDAGE